MPYKDKAKQREAQRLWAEKNRAVISERQKTKRNQIRRYIEEYKTKNSTCIDCGISYPPHILDFDHLEDKSFGLAGAARDNKPLEEVVAEIAKCEIVCANCHRHRTWIRKMAP